MSIVSSQSIRAEGVELREEIDRHAKAMYDRIEREEQKLLEELQQLRALKQRFGWVAPQENRGLESMAGRSAQGQNIHDQRRAIAAVKEENRG